MKDQPLMCVTRVLDDDTGIWAGDLCEFSIYLGRVEQFLKSHGKKGANEICSMLDTLKKKNYGNA